MTTVTEGDVHTFEREFSTDEVRTFAEISGDDQPRHVEPDEDGELMAQGLLTATIPTNVGAEIGVLGRAITLEFHKPVYTGETIACEWRNDAVEEGDDRYYLTADVRCTDESGDVVMTATFRGIVRKDG